MSRDFTSFVPEDDGFGASERWGILSVMTNGELHEWTGLEVLEDRTCYPFVRLTITQRDTDNKAEFDVDYRNLDEDGIWRIVAGYLDLHDFEQEIA